MSLLEVCLMHRVTSDRLQWLQSGSVSTFSQKSDRSSCMDVTGRARADQRQVERESPPRARQ